jgi:hypothetical protein
MFLNKAEFERNASGSVSRNGATNATTAFWNFVATFAPLRETFPNLRACPWREFPHKGCMATSSSKKPAPTFTETVAGVKKAAAPYLTPYYLVYGAVLGAITTGFIVLTLIIVLVATNFNLLGLIE